MLCIEIERELKQVSAKYIKIQVTEGFVLLDGNSVGTRIWAS